MLICDTDVSLSQIKCFEVPWLYAVCPSSGERVECVSVTSLGSQIHRETAVKDSPAGAAVPLFHGRGRMWARILSQSLASADEEEAAAAAEEEEEDDDDDLTTTE